MTAESERVSASDAPARTCAEKAHEPPTAETPRPPHRMKKRRDFLAAAKARKWATPGFILQGRRRAHSEDVVGPRVGFTASKKVGNAVARNRAKRRLRAVADMLLGQAGRADWDYVLVARAETTVGRAFSDLRSDLETAISRVHGQKPQKTKERGARSTAPKTRSPRKPTAPPTRPETAEPTQ